MSFRIFYFSDCHIYGGSERNIINLLNYIANQSGVEVFFAYRYYKTYQMGVDRDLSKKANAIPLRLLSNDTFFHWIDQNVRTKIFRRLCKLPLWLLEKTGLYLLYDYAVLFHTLTRIKPDLVHVNNGGYPGSFLCRTAIFSAKHAGIEHIVFHINNLAQRQKHLFEKWIDKRIDAYTNYFITASRQASLSLSERRFFPEHKLIQLYNTVESPEIVKSRDEICEKYNVDNSKFILCEVAFLSQRKGQVYILRALRKIRELHPEIFSKLVLFLVGNGEDEHILKNYCQDHALSNVIFTGYKKNYADFIACTDIFLLPSIEKEDMPLVVLSAMSLGKPIIASSCAGIAEEIENQKSGILLDVAHLDQLSTEIVRLINKEELRLYYGDNARKRFDEYFAPDKIYNKIKALYAMCLNQA